MRRARGRADHRQRVPRPACTAEHDRLLPRVSNADPQIAAVADDRGHCMRQVVKIEHQLGHALSG